MARRRSARPTSAAATYEFAGKYSGSHNTACFCELRDSSRRAVYLASLRTAMQVAIGLAARPAPFATVLLCIVVQTMFIKVGEIDEY